MKWKNLADLEQIVKHGTFTHDFTSKSVVVPVNNIYVYMYKRLKN